MKCLKGLKNNRMHRVRRSMITALRRDSIGVLTRSDTWLTKIVTFAQAVAQPGLP